MGGGAVLDVPHQPEAPVADRLGASFVGDRRAARSGRIAQQRDERAAVERGGRRQVAQLAEGREQVDALHDPGRGGPGRTHPGYADDQRRPQGFLEQRVLAPDAVLAQVPAVVTPQGDDRVFAQAQLVEPCEHPADQRVDVGHAGRVVPTQLVRVGGVLARVAAVVGVLVEHLAAAVPGGAARRLVRVRDRRQLDVAVGLHVARGRSEGQVGADEADRQEERLPIGRQALQLRHGFARDPAVGVGLVRAVEGLQRRRVAGAAHVALGQGVHGALGRAPGAGRHGVARPGAGHLDRLGVVPALAVTPAGVVGDLAHRHRGVAGGAEELGQGSRRALHALGALHESVVAAARAALGVAAGQQRIARRAAGRRLHVMAREGAPLGGEPVDVRRFDVVDSEAGELGAQVVHAEQQDVGALAQARRGGGAGAGQRQERRQGEQDAR